MDKEQKRALKKAAKFAIAEESQKLREILAKTNKAPFASDEYLRNAIELRRDEIQMREKPRRILMDEINRRFLVKPYDFDSAGNYPLNHTVFWFCPKCESALPTCPRFRMTCECGNLSVGFSCWTRTLAHLVFARQGLLLRARFNWVDWTELVVRGEAKVTALNLFPER